VLHQVVREHLETFLAEARLRGTGEGLPRFVERELREFLTCGVLAEGFARFRCTDCQHEILVAFSCKGRGFCPSCCGRRMAELAAHLVDGVLGGLPVRQWVLTLPYRLRYALAWDHRLCRAVLGVFIRAVLGFERRSAERRGLRGGAGGAVTAIQRFGSALNINVHFHTLVAQGVFVEEGEETRRFLPLPAPTDLEVERLLAVVRRRIVRLVARYGIDLEDPSGEAQPTDERLFDCPMYAEIQGAAVVGRVVTGPRAGGPVQRVGRDRYAAEVASTGPLHAHLDGFDLHAAVAVPPGDRKRLEHLCRYVLRPPIAQERLERAPDGAVLLRLRRPWSDGTRAIRFEPNELLEKLAAMVPKPRINLLI
jgi:Putative transposase/Transposase zinc-binding domain